MTTPIRNWQKIFRLKFLYSEENKQCQCCNSWLEIWRRYWSSKKMVPSKGFNLLMVLFTTVPCSTVSHWWCCWFYHYIYSRLWLFRRLENYVFVLKPNPLKWPLWIISARSVQDEEDGGFVWSYLLVTWCIVFEWCNRVRWGHACDWTLQEILLNSLYYTLSSTRSQFLEFVNIDWTHLEPFLAII